MTPAHLRIRARKIALRTMLVCALTMPAAALAAEPVSEALDRDAALGAGPQPDAVSDLSGPFAPAPRGGVGEGARRKKPTGPFHPVDGSVDYGDVGAAFGNARGRPHEGQDIFAPAGTPVVAPTDALVVEAGTDGGRGNWISIYDRERGHSYSYFHLIGRSKAAAGERVRAGEKLGEVGCTGSCSGEHLHFEIRDGKGPYGAARDPMAFLKRTDRA